MHFKDGMQGKQNYGQITTKTNCRDGQVFKKCCEVRWSNINTYFPQKSVEQRGFQPSIPQ